MGNAISHGTANDENVIVQVTYDKAGRRVAVRDPRGNQTTYAYDQLDRRISLSNPLDQTWATAYSDLSGGWQRVTRTNPLGQQVEEDYDRLGRLLRVCYLNETPKHTPDVVFRYDAAGNRVAMDETLDGGLTWLRKTQYSYDGVGRLVSVGFDTNGDGVVEQTVTYQYDAGGRRTQMTLPGNKTMQYAYDVKGQLVSLTDWDGQVTRYRYDNAGRLREAQAANLLTRRWRYDPAGRLRGLRHSREGKTLGDFTYEVDRRGNRTQVRECVPQAATGATVLAHSSPAIDYVRGTWAAVGDFHETTNMGAALRAEVFGTELTLVMGQGPDHSLYDLYLNGTLRDSLDGYAATPGERSLTYSLTDEGPHTVEVRNRTDKSLASSGYTLRFKRLETNRRYDLHIIQYSYDKLERLRAADYRPAANLSAAPFREHSYAYDVAGNRTQVNDNGAVTNYTYNAANQITNPGFSYDAAGRMTSDSTNTYAWDRADRLMSMGGVQNQYNGLGQRVQQSIGAQVTQYLLDTQPGLWQVLASTTGADTTRYVHGPAGIQQQQNSDDAWLYPAQDALGSVRSVADEDMAVLESRQYEPYGEPWGMTGTPQTDFGFTGEPTDENGLVHLRARHYNPVLGTFSSLDPIEGDYDHTLSPNSYRYVEGNVANLVDPSGKTPTGDAFTCGLQTIPSTCWIDSTDYCCQYLRIEAKKYAIDWADESSPNPAYAYYNSAREGGGEDTNCANFASQALRKGNHPMRRPAESKTTDTEHWFCRQGGGICEGSRVWRLAPCLARYLTSLPGTQVKNEDIQPVDGTPLVGGDFVHEEYLRQIERFSRDELAGTISVGDILYWGDIPSDCDHLDSGQHVAIVVGWGPVNVDRERIPGGRIDRRQYWSWLRNSPPIPIDTHQNGYVPYVVDNGRSWDTILRGAPFPYYLLKLGDNGLGGDIKFIKVPNKTCVPLGEYAR